jgi:hypothetical protein
MGKTGNLLLQQITVLVIVGFGSINAAIAAPPAPRRLDLRAPASLVESAAARVAEFPNMLHRQSSGPQPENRFAGFNASLPQISASNRIEEMARRVHREGLPVARLWENHAALVSLGLNQRGKPGLWIVQKVH